MLIYSKKVEDEIRLFGTLNNIPSEDDAQLIYTDAENVELENRPTLDDTYLDNGKGGIIQKSTGEEIKVFIDTTNVIPGDSSEPVPPKVTVSFDMQGHGEQIAPQKVMPGSTATRPANPSASGYSFGNWYTESEYINIYNFNTPVMQDITLYAKWNDISDFCIEFSSDESFTLSTDKKKKSWNGTLEYSNDKIVWTTWNGYTTLTSGSNNKIYIRGINNTVITGETYSTQDEEYVWYPWSLSGSNINCSGNIETLLDYLKVANGIHPSMSTYCYEYMFQNCTSLISVPELPATALAPYCYFGMFFGCTALTAVPALPATTITSMCYKMMFYGCTNIKLSTTQTADYTTAYRIPKEGTGTDVTNALYNMFYSTGGTFTGTPTINTTYYLHKDNHIV